MVSGENMIYKKGIEGKASLLSMSLHTTVSELKIVGPNINIIVYPVSCNNGKKNPELFISNSEVHRYNTHSSKKVHIPRIKTELSRK